LGTEEADGGIRDDLGERRARADIFVRNLGGAAPEVAVELEYEPEESDSPFNTGDAVLTPADPATVGRTDDVGLATCTVSRDGLVPGDYGFTFVFRWNNQVTADIFTSREFRVGYTVPSLAVLPERLRVESDENTGVLTLFNRGGAALDWSITNAGAAPSWLIPTQTNGTLTGGESNEVLFDIDRTGLAPGEFSFTLEFSSSLDVELAPAKITVEVVP